MPFCAEQTRNQGLYDLESGSKVVTVQNLENDTILNFSTPPGKDLEQFRTHSKFLNPYGKSSNDILVTVQIIIAELFPNFI